MYHIHPRQCTSAWLPLCCVCVYVLQVACGEMLWSNDGEFIAAETFPLLCGGVNNTLDTCINYFSLTVVKLK